MVAPTATAGAAPEPFEGLGAAGSPGRDLISSLLPERSAQDILAGEVHVRLGGRSHTLPVLSIGATRRWQATLEGTLTGIFDTVEGAGDDLSQVLGALAGATDQMLDAIYGYDSSHVLPPRAQLEEEATDSEVMAAAFTLWAVANPFALVAVSAMRSGLGTGEPPTSA